MRPVAAAVVVSALLLAGCGDGGDEVASDATTTTTTAATLEEVPVDADAPAVFEGDPDSAFCQRSRDAAGRPVLDPFAPGLEPREVRLRFGALAQRFGELADVAPAPLEEDLTLLDQRFDELAELLAGADFDFALLVEQGADLSAFDDPVFDAVARRLAAYQEQVCTRAG